MGPMQIGLSGMNKLTEKNKYTLLNFRRDGDNGTNQEITFYKLNSDGSFENGTTIEEVLTVSIKRLTDNKLPCRETSLAITKLEEALMWLNKSKEDRVFRNIEGKHIA